MALSWRSAALIAVGALVGLTMACGDTPSQTPDAGVDAGNTQKDAGTGPKDAGPQEEPDAGMELPDAGEDPDAGTEDAGTEPNCGDFVSGTFGNHQRGVGWPDLPPTQDMPSCSTGNADDDCSTFFVQRFTDQAALEAFFQSEFQSPPPYTNVNWALADVIVTWNCACPTYGYSLTTTHVAYDGCRVLVETFQSTPGEDCFTWQTMNRQWSAVQVSKLDESLEFEVENLSQAQSCGP